MSDRTRIVIALGGNALQSKKSEPTAEAQLEVVKRTCEYIAEISSRGYEMAVVHGSSSPRKQRRMWSLPCPLMYAEPCPRGT